MKKFLAKIALFSIISVIAGMLNLSASAQENEIQNLSEALEDAKEKPCIKDENEDAPDYNYIITIIEEPLSLEEEGKTPQDEYATRICFRNHFSYESTVSGRETINVLSEICSEDITNFESRFGAIKDKYNIRYSCDPVQVILSRGGTSLIEGYIGSIYRWGASIAGIIAVLVIIFSGIQIATAGGEPQAIEDAKKRIIKSLAGLVVLFLSGLILYTINPNFFVR